MQLNWEDTKEVILDSSVNFGVGYDFFGMESLREEADTPIGRFMVYPEYNPGNDNPWGSKFSLYGGQDGYHQTDFKTSEECKNEVEKLVKYIIGGNK